MNKSRHLNEDVQGSIEATDKAFPYPWKHFFGVHMGARKSLFYLPRSIFFRLILISPLKSFIYFPF
jgi:hypothetical protein